MPGCRTHAGPGRGGAAELRSEARRSKAGGALRRRPTGGEAATEKATVNLPNVQPLHPAAASAATAAAPSRPGPPPAVGPRNPVAVAWPLPFFGLPGANGTA